MNPRRLASLWAVILFAGLARAGDKPLFIVSKTPLGRTESRTAAYSVTATFSEPMVALTAPGEMGDFCPLRLEPAVKGRCRWQGTQVVAFEPEEPLVQATEYKVVVPAETASKVSGNKLVEEVSWTFETVRPALGDSIPRNGEKWIDVDASLFVRFTLPVDPRRLRDFIALEEMPVEGGETREVPLNIRRAKAEEIKEARMWVYGGMELSSATVMLMSPSRRLQPEMRYRVVYKEGLPAAMGTLGTLRQHAVEFETYRIFAAGDFPEKSCLPHWFRFSMTNPVQAKELYAHMSVDPSTPIPKVEGWEGDQTGERDMENRRVWFSMPGLAYEPNKTYTFTIDGKLKDAFGNALGQDVVFRLETDDYCPSVVMQGGVGVLESYLPRRHPVEVVNASDIPVEKVEIPHDQVIPFLKKWERPAKMTAKNWNPAAGRNVRVRTFLDADEVLGAGKGGFVLTRLYNKYSPHPNWISALDNVTRVGLTLKSAPESTLIFASYLRTAAPAPGVPVELRDDNNKLLWQGVTGKSGFADAPGWMELGITDWPRWQRPTLWAFAKDPQGTAGLSIQWRNGLDPWRFGITYDWSPRPHNNAGFLFTERGIYRPGETVYAKGILRALTKGDWANAGFKTLQAVVTDSRGARVFKSTVAVSELSSFDLSYAVPEEAPTGLWTLSVTEPFEEDGSVVRPVEEDEEGEWREYQGKERRVNLQRSFRVEAFKPASFEVKVTPSLPSFIAGDQYQAVVDGWYLFGAPMAKAPVEWKLRLAPGSFRPEGFDEYSFSPADWTALDRRWEQLLGGDTGTLDGDGKLTVRQDLKAARAGQPVTAVLEAGVTSPDRQRLFGRAATLVHPANLYLGVKQQKFFLEQGQTWNALIAALRPDGKRAEKIKFAGELVRREWLSVQRAGLGGRLEWVSERKDTVVSSFTAVSTAKSFPWSTVPQKPGYYLFTAKGEDEEGREVRGGTSFYVTGDGDSWWTRSDAEIVELVPDKKRYAPGETARILVKSPYPKSKVMVTLERETVIDRWVTELSGSAQFIEVPLTERHLPNVYVGVMLVQGRAETKYDETGNDLAKPQAKFGYVDLAVSPAGRRLAVEVKSDAGQYRPGKPVTVDLSVKDEAGNPAPAELTVFAVDEGVLALTGYGTPDPFDAFYGPRPLLVGTADTRQSIIGQRNFGEKGENRGGGGGDGEGLEGIDLRTRFVPTAYWNPTVTPDAQGKARLTFTLPDNLTRFRLMAVAHADKRFGADDAKFTVSKPLLLRPSLPRFARVGDEFQGGVVVHNYSTAAVTAALDMTAAGQGISCEGGASRSVEVPGGQAKELLWTCKAVSLGTAAFRFRARAGAETDGLEWSVSVKPAERLETVATAGVAEPNAVEELRLPAGALKTLGGLDIGLSPTALAGLREGARYLLEYPYYCLEQRLSRMMPVIVGAELTAAFNLGTMGDLKAEVQKELNGLPKYQHPSGGYMYWPDGWLPDPYITARALETAHLAAQEKYVVPAESLQKAVRWLGEYLTQKKRDWAYPYNESEDYAARAYAVYALALHKGAPGNYFQQLYAKRDQIPYLAKAYLLKAAPLVSSDASAQKTLAAEILNQSRLAPTTLHFEEPAETLMPWVHGSTVKATALGLQSLLEAQGGFPGDEKAVRWLTQERKNLGRWRTTEENALSLRAFQDFYRRYEKDVPDFQATVTAGGKTLAKQAFKGRSLDVKTTPLTLGTLFSTGDTARLSLDKKGTGRLYYALRMRYAPARFETPASEGFTIERTVKPLYGGGDQLKAGARAVVTLKVTTKQDRTFVALNDPLPAGFEIVDPTFSTESAEDARAAREVAGNNRGRWWGEFHRAENYDDRIHIFADFLTEGEHTYSYLVQATTAGRYSAPAAWIEQMYEPEVFGRTATGTVEVK